MLTRRFPTKLLAVVILLAMMLSLIPMASAEGKGGVVPPIECHVVGVYGYCDVPIAGFSVTVYLCYGQFTLKVYLDSDSTSFATIPIDHRYSHCDNHTISKPWSDYPTIQSRVYNGNPHTLKAELVGYGSMTSSSFTCAPPESVDLASFSVTPGRGGILIAWETASEINNLGFNLYRSTGDNPQTAIKINSQLIPSRWAGVAGASYSYLDRTARPAVSYHYWLEDVEAGDGVMQIGLHDLGRGQWNRPLVIALWPKNSGQVYSTPQRFTATFRDADGDLSKVSLLIGDSPAAAAKVVARYDRSTRQFSLVGGTYAALHRAACGVRVEEGGQKLTVTWTLSFKEGFRGVHNLYLRAQDAPGNITPWRLMGTWNVR